MKVRFENKPIKKLQDLKVILPVLLIGQGIAIVLLVWLLIKG
jgi:hypothetical protein